MLEMFQRTETAEMNDDDVIVQIDLDRKSTAQESLKVQRQIQKQSQETARAEKEKKENSDDSTLCLTSWLTFNC